MSKFFEGGDSQSGSENEDQQEPMEEVTEKKKKQMIHIDFSSDEETKDKKKRTLTEKEKKFKQWKEIIKRIQTKIKINDFTEIYELFEELNKQIQKSKKFVEDGYPTFYIQICMIIEVLVTNLGSDELKKLNASNKKAFQIMKQKIKKHNKSIENQIEEFKKDPKNFQLEESEEEEEEASEDEAQEEKQSEGEGNDEEFNFGESADEGEEDNETDEDPEYDQFNDEFKFSDSDGEDEKREEQGSDGEEVALKNLNPIKSNDPEERRKYWLKTWVDDEKVLKKDDKEKKKKGGFQKKIKKGIQIQDDDKQKVQIDLTKVEKYLKNIIENRLRRPGLNEENYEFIKDLYNLLAEDQLVSRLEVILIMLPLGYDTSKMVQSQYMPRKFWLELLERNEEMFKIISQLKDEQMNEVQTYTKEENKFYTKEGIMEALIGFTGTLNNEIFKAFKHTDSGSLEYIERMQDQFKLLKFLKVFYDYLQQINDNQNLKDIAFFRLENLYYVHDATIEKLKRLALAKEQDITNEFFECTSSQNLIHTLSILIYQHGDDKQKIYAILMQIYHHCLHDRIDIAKDFLLMSHIADHITTAEHQAQSLYNRVIVQLGLAYFRTGQLAECNQCLIDIISTGRIREFLAQGLSKYPDKDEKRRLLPYHYHINIEAVETSYYISALLLDLPTIAQEQIFGWSKRPVSKSLKKLFENYEKILLSVSPETYRDYIYAVSKQMLQGNWQKSIELIHQMNIWKSMTQAETVKEGLKQKIKECCLKCYLVTHRNSFQILKFQHLSENFEMSIAEIKSVLAKLIYTKELNASLDEKTQSVKLNVSEYSRLQKLCMNLLDKLSTSITINEKIFEGKFGNYGCLEKDLLENAFKKYKFYC